MPHRAKPHVHGRDHEHGGADPTLIHWEDVDPPATGKFSKVKWGDGLTTTDEGSNVIRVDGVTGGGTGGGIQFDTSPQVGGFLETTTTGSTGTQINATGSGDVTLNSEANDNLYAAGINIIASGDGGIQLEVTGDGDLVVTVHSPTTNLKIFGLPTTNPGGTHRVWNNGGVLSIT